MTKNPHLNKSSSFITLNKTKSNDIEQSNSKNSTFIVPNKTIPKDIEPMKKFLTDMKKNDDTMSVRSGRSNRSNHNIHMKKLDNV